MTTIPIDTYCVTIDSLKTATDALLRLTARARRVLRDPDFPVEPDDAEQFHRSQPDALRTHWSRVGVASGVVDDFERVVCQAEDITRQAVAYVDTIERQAATAPVGDLKGLEGRERLEAEAKGLRGGLATFTLAVEAGRDPLRLLTTLVGQAVETALIFDRDVNRRRILHVVERAQQQIAAIRATADEHAPLRARWEERLGRRFALRDLPSPTVTP
jgi:hypothetical protein